MKSARRVVAAGTCRVSAGRAFKEMLETNVHISMSEPWQIAKSSVASDDIDIEQGLAHEQIPS